MLWSPATPSSPMHLRIPVRAVWAIGWTPRPPGCCSRRGPGRHGRRCAGPSTGGGSTSATWQGGGDPTPGWGGDLPRRHRADHVEPAPDGQGREALSRFRVLSRRGDLALLEVSIVTGV